MEKFMFVCLLGICVVSDVFAVDETHYSTYEWMKGKLVKMLCRLDSETKPASPPEVSVSPVCDNRWTRFESSCYLFGTEKMSFEDAKAFCEEFDAHIVSIQNEIENKFLKDYMTQLSDAAAFWTGLTDQVTEGVWRWTDTDDEAQFVGWQSSQPNGAHSSNCATLLEKFSYSWGDEACDRQFRPVCEK